MKTLLLLVFLKTVFSAEDDPLVELPTGKILGTQAKTFANTTYSAFWKIPYAAPPVGPLRFKAPQPSKHWDDILDASSLDVTCYQLNPSPLDSEDCLFLNVFSPQLPDEENENVSLPVMLYIHGGGFTAGSSLDAPPDLFVDNGVVLVSINYRLGPFGFLSTGDHVIPGNNGLKDQKLAIEWTHKNIHLFGGDPDKITIFGESAGSASVGFQLLNQDLSGLIKGAILESGTFLMEGSFQRDPQSLDFSVATGLNSTFESRNDSNSLLEFLQGIDADDLYKAASQVPGSRWPPVIEVKNPDAFLTRKMYGLLQAGNILPVPTLIGFNSEETITFNQDPERLQAVVQGVDDNVHQLVPEDMEITDPDEHGLIAVTIRDIYTGGGPFGTNLGAYLKYSSDNSFNRPIAKHAELFSSLADTFFYQFSYDGKLGNVDAHYDGADSVGHTEELRYLFCSGDACDFSTYPESDQTTSNRLIKLWTDFAKYQNPTPEESELLQNVTWPKLSVEEGDFLYLDINEDLEVKNHPKQETLQKWEDLYTALDYKDFVTY